MKSLPSIITLIRIIMIFVAILALTHSRFALRLCGFFVLCGAFVLDGLDGFLARKLRISNKVGSLIDTLGDRITENVILVFFAYKNIIPLFIPFVFITRSFISDFIRCLAFSRGMGTFSINKSRFGYYIVASKTSRSVYLVFKFLVFLLGAFILVYPATQVVCNISLLALLFYMAIILTAVNILRFIALVFDSRHMLKEIFLEH